MAIVSASLQTEAPSRDLDARPPALSWSSLLAGCLTVLGIQLLLTLLLSGLGWPLLYPLTKSEHSTNFSSRAGLVWSASALIALWFGGWMAGRVARARTANLGGLHGLVVWSAITVLALAFFFAATAGPRKFSNRAQLADTKSVAANENAGAITSASINPIQEFLEKNPDPISSFADEAVAANPHLSASDAVRARREIGWTLVRFFSSAQKAASENRAATAKVVAEAVGLDLLSAEKMVDQWAVAYGRVTQDLALAKAALAREQQGNEAELTSPRAKAAVWTFVAFVIGAFSSVWGGRSGANAAWNAKQEELAAEMHWRGE